MQCGCDGGAATALASVPRALTTRERGEYRSRASECRGAPRRLRALHNGSIYDAWLPLRYHSTRAEEDAIAGRVLVAGVPLSRASGANATQKHSRGALRVRVSMTWQ